MYWLISTSFRVLKYPCIMRYICPQFLMKYSLAKIHLNVFRELVILHFAECRHHFKKLNIILILFFFKNKMVAKFFLMSSFFL